MSSAERLREPLGALERCLRARQPDYYAALRPGLDEARVAELTAALPNVRLPEPLLELYRWRDPPGETTRPWVTDDTWLLLSAAEVVEEHRRLGARLGGQGAGGDPWDPRWVPFLRSGSGDLLCVVAEGEPADTPCGGAPPGAVVEVPRDSESRPLRFASLSSWLELTVAGLARGLLRIEEDGGLHPSDPFAWEAFLAAENPGYAVGDPEPEVPTEVAAPARSQVLVGLLRRVATGIGTVSFMTLAVVARVFRRQLPRAGFLVIVIGLVVALLFLLAAQVIVWRHRQVVG